MVIYQPKMAILYQLQSGKVIKISVEDFLNMNDEIEQQLISQNAGDTITSPWHNSIIISTEKELEKETFPEDFDYDADSDELKSEQEIDINNIPSESSSDEFSF